MEIETEFERGLGGPLRSLHPLVKLLAAVVLCASAFAFRPWQVPAALALGTALLYVLPGVGLRRLAAAARPMPFFVLVIVIANLFLVPHGGGAWGGVALGFVRSARVLALVFTTGLFLSTTDPVDLSDAFFRALAPLRRVGIRAGEFALMTMIVQSFVPLMIEEARRLELARAARCGFPRRGIGALRSVVPLLAPLFVGVLRRADEVDLALRARAFRLDAPRTSLGRTGLSAVDWIVAALFCAAFIAGVYAQLQARL